MARKAKPKRRKPGSGAVRFKRGRDRPWEAAFPLGQGEYRYESFTTRQDAQAHLDKLAAERDDTRNPRNIAGGAQSLYTFLNDWLTLKEPHIKPKTYQDYGYQCEIAIGYFGDVRIDSLTRKDCDLFLAAIHRQGYKNVAHLRVVLSQAFKYAEDIDYIRGNPFQRAKAPPVTRAPRIALTKAQRAAMLDAAAGEPLEVLWHLYSRLGLRRGEGIGLLWANVDWSAGTISITQQYTSVGGKVYKGTPKTRRSRRTFPVFDDVLDKLRALQKAQREMAAVDPSWTMTGLVFTDAHGGALKPDYVWRQWKKLRKRCGLPVKVSIHDLRHTALTMLEQSGAPLSVVQLFAGHTSETMTRHYTDHADLDAMRAALAKLA